MPRRGVDRLLAWWLLAPYPRAFRRRFEEDLREHLARERAEARYGTPIWGGVRFAVEAGWNAWRTGLGLRVRDVFGAGQRAGYPGGREVGPLLRPALRSLRRSPGYAAVFVGTLGLGIGANTAVFSAVRGVLLQPLPHDDVERIVYLRHDARLAGLDNVFFSVPEIDDYRRATPSLDELAEFSALTFTMLTEDDAVRVRAGIVSANFFSVMGLTALQGRLVGDADAGADAPSVMVLSDAYWRTRFGADPSVVGRTVEMNGRSVMVVGVLEPAPPYPERTDVWVNLSASPHHLDAAMTHDRDHRMTEVFGSLAPGATVTSVNRELEAATPAIHGENPEAYDEGSGYAVRATSFERQLNARARPTFLVLMGTAGLVFLIACANLANLALTRGLGRQGEFAVRSSLGGSRAAIRRQLLAEHLVLALLGAVAGIGLAWASLGLLVAFAERFTARATEIRLDAVVFAFAVGTSLLASVLFAWMPRLPSGGALGAVLKGGGTRTTQGGRTRRVQRGLVVAQVAISCVLLVGAGLLLRTMGHLSAVEPGFESERVLSLEIPIDGAGLTGADVVERNRRYLRVVEELPGVEGAALTNVVPMAGTLGSFTARLEVGVDGFVPVEGAPIPRAELRVVSPGYFATLGTPVLAGRAFHSGDTEVGSPSVVVNRSFADELFVGRDPIGGQVTWTDDLIRFLGIERSPRTVVGVVEDTRDAGVDAPPVPTIYHAYPSAAWSGALVVRSSADPRDLVPRLREAIRAIDPLQPIDNVATLAEFEQAGVAPRRLNTILLGAFGVLATTIAAVGIGSVLALSVRMRLREFGVRRVLGATGREIRGDVLREGVHLAAMGLGLGVASAALLSRGLRSLVVGVPLLDATTYVAVTILLGLIAALASWLPAGRASRVAPTDALAVE